MHFPQFQIIPYARVGDREGEYAYAAEVSRRTLRSTEERGTACAVTFTTSLGAVQATEKKAEFPGKAEGTGALILGALRHPRISVSGHRSGTLIISFCLSLSLSVADAIADTISRLTSRPSSVHLLLAGRCSQYFLASISLCHFDHLLCSRTDRSVSLEVEGDGATAAAAVLPPFPRVVAREAQQRGGAATKGETAPRHSLLHPFRELCC